MNCIISFKYRLKTVWYELCTATGMVDKLYAVRYVAQLGETSKTNHKVCLVGIWRVLATGKQNARFGLFPGRNTEWHKKTGTKPNKN